MREGRRPLLRQRLGQNAPTFCFKSNIPHPLVIELLSQYGVACLWLDCEHMPTDQGTLAELIRACRGFDIDSLVRVPHGELALAARMLDAGADALMYPRCRDAGAVRALVQATRFPPRGLRGVDTAVAATLLGAGGLGESLRREREDQVLIVQIETPQAVEAVDEIASVPGVDMLFVGPGDLSVELGLSFGFGLPLAPAIEQAIDTVARAAEAHGIAWGMPALSLEHAAALVQRGAALVAHGSDTSVLGKQVARLVDDMAELGIQSRP